MLREIVDQSIHIHLLPISTRENALLSSIYLAENRMSYKWLGTSTGEH